jgi:hypothetical protein
MNTACVQSTEVESAMAEHSYAHRLDRSLSAEGFVFVILIEHFLVA